MTAEAIVMNKFGLAIAADSVIASHSSNSPKLYNSIEKLFRLTDNGKIAVMIYEATEFMNIPWETLISDYRTKVAQDSFDTVAEYAADFLAYLKSIEVDEEEKEHILLSSLTEHYANLAQHLHKGLSAQMREDSSVVDSLRRWVEGQLELIEDDLEANNTLAELATIDRKDFYRRYFRVVGNARSQGFFSNFKVKQSGPIKKLLLRLGYLFAVKDTFSSFSTGLVFAGFGDRELLPTALSYRVEALLPDGPKIKLQLKRQVSGTNQGMIIPFAQSDMVYRFLQGTDKDYDAYLSGLYQELSNGISEYLINRYVPDDLKEEAREKAGDILDEKFDSIAGIAANYRMLNFANPVIDAVKNLPKPELATLAEALVHLTSLRRKMSVDIETAGEPIDVAVVSKSDGFVWIKRKTYYDRQLNSY